MGVSRLLDSLALLPLLLAVIAAGGLAYALGRRGIARSSRRE